MRILVVAFLLFYQISFAQSSILPTSRFVEMNGFFSTDGLNPFWMRSNQYGSVPLQSQVGVFSAGISKKLDSTQVKMGKTSGFQYSVEALGVLGKNSGEIILPEVFLSYRFKAFEMYAGRRKETIGLVDTLLSSGNYAYSKNALPIPKIQISIPDYIQIGRNSLFAFKGDFAYGHLGNQYYVKNQKFHYKSLFIRLGKPDWKIKLFAGGTHQILFGGELNNIKTLRSVANNKFPNSLSDYIYATLGVTLNKTSNQTIVDPENYTSYDLTNRVGNHFGSVDIGMSLNTHYFDLLAYRQSVYDDGSLFYLNNIYDGLFGISLKFKNPPSSRLFVKQFLVEYFNSSSQGGPIPPNKSTVHENRGADNYFNHGQFVDGWSYYNNSLGTPFISSHKYLKGSLPQYINKSISEVPIYYFTNNNRVQALYLGAIVQFNRTELELKGSYSKNLGSYFRPFEKRIAQFSTLAQVVRFIPTIKTTLSLAVAFDSDGIVNQHTGLKLGIRKWF